MPFDMVRCTAMRWQLGCGYLLGLRLSLEACETSISFDAILSLPVADLGSGGFVIQMESTSAPLPSHAQYLLSVMIAVWCFLFSAAFLS